MSPRAAKKKKQSLPDLLRAGRIDEFVKLALDMEPVDLADVLSSLDDEERLTAVRALPPEVSGEALTEMPEDEHAEDTLAALEPEQAADIVDEMADDDAADLLQDLDPEEQERILSEVEDRAEVDRLLAYDEESAGGLMTSHVVTVLDVATAGRRSRRSGGRRRRWRGSTRCSWWTAATVSSGCFRSRTSSPAPPIAPSGSSWRRPTSPSRPTATRKRSRD